MSQEKKYPRKRKSKNRNVNSKAITNWQMFIKTTEEEDEKKKKSLKLILRWKRLDGADSEIKNQLLM